MNSLRDKYELGEKLGQGGMGAVYAARNKLTGRRVAIKLVPEKSGTDEDMAVRFLREARAASAIEHPNVVQVFDAGQSDGHLFMVMELMDGEPLSKLIHREAPLEPQRIIDILGPILDALAFAHGHGIIHRDIKPANIFLARMPHSNEAVPKLLDFGIAKYSEDVESLGLTQSGTIMGTPYYMSPEQLQAREAVDHRADLYSVGVILYEALSGQKPFYAESYASLIVAILQTEPVEIQDLSPDLSPALVGVVSRALQKDRERRFKTSEEMREALELVSSELSTVNSKELATMAGSSAPSESASARPWVPRVALAAGLLLAAGAVVLGMRALPERAATVVTPVTTPSPASPEAESGPRDDSSGAGLGATPKETESGQPPKPRTEEPAPTRARAPSRRSRRPSKSAPSALPKTTDDGVGRKETPKLAPAGTTPSVQKRTPVPIDTGGARPSAVPEPTEEREAPSRPPSRRRSRSGGLSEDDF